MNTNEQNNIFLTKECNFTLFQHDNDFCNNEALTLVNISIEYQVPSPECTPVTPTPPPVCIDIKSLEKGNWVVVSYEEKKYPGEVTALHLDTALIGVSVMHSKYGKAWACPEKEDKILYGAENIVKVIPPPVPSDRRGHFKFEDDF